MLTIMGIFISLVFFISLVYAETLEIDIAVEGLDPVIETETYEGVEIEYEVFTDYDVSFYGLNTYYYDNVLDGGEGNFKAQLLSSSEEILFEKYFEPSFIILSNPTTETDFDIVSLEFPFVDNIEYLRIYCPGELISADINGDGIVDSQDFGILKANFGNVADGFGYVLCYGDELMVEEEIGYRICNNNGVCEDEENYHSCPSDCRWYDADGACLGYGGDYFCDVDCFADSDCETENCNDGIKNQDETSVDSGGVCEVSCYDGIANGDEDDVDCGGSCVFCEVEYICCGNFDTSRYEEWI